MTKGKLFVFSFLFLLSSCGSIVKTLAGFKNPKVENKENLNRYFKDVMPNEKTFFLTVEKVGDSASIYDSFLFGFGSEMKIFSKSGQKYCYNGTEECSGIQMTSAFANFNEVYIPCVEKTDENLNNFLTRFADENGNKTVARDLPDSDYYIFQNWTKYSGSKKRFEQDAKWVLSLKQNSHINVTIVFINGDLLEEWGLQEGDELKTKFRKKGRSFSVNFGKLPLKK